VPLEFPSTVTNMTALRYRAWAKATEREAGAPQYSASWVVSRRAWFRAYGDRIECGDWVIPADSVDDAVLYHTRQMGIPINVLSITSRGRTMQFGFNPWAKISRHLPFPYRNENVRLRYSRVSLIMRVIFVLAIVYWLLSR
jgi:hypothetical protein